MTHRKVTNIRNILYCYLTNGIEENREYISAIAHVPTSHMHEINVNKLH